MTKTYLKIVRIMCRSNFYNSGSKFRIYIFICNQRNFSSDKRYYQHLTYQMTVSLIFRMNCHSRIPDNCFRSCCRNFQEFIRILEHIFKMPKMSVVIFVIYLCIRKRSLAIHTPVNDTISTINIAFFIQLHKKL